MGAGTHLANQLPAIDLSVRVTRVSQVLIPAATPHWTAKGQITRREISGSCEENKKWHWGVCRRLATNQKNPRRIRVRERMRRKRGAAGQENRTSISVQFSQWAYIKKTKTAVTSDLCAERWRTSGSDSSGRGTRGTRGSPSSSSSTAQSG